MAIHAVIWWLLTALSVYKVGLHHVTAELTVTPVDTNATVGSQVRLSCSTDASKEVNWQFGEELNSMTDVYIAKEGLSRQFKESLRHKIDINSAIGQYDLLISDVTPEDDGFYICSEPGLWGNPPHAKLTITGGELPAKVCRENVIATKGGDLGITFSACSPEPYLSHVPVGLSHSKEVYNFGNLLNDYADSGRFAVDIVSEVLRLSITKILLSDAGMYTCRGYSGHGERHNKELVVLDGMPTCTANISDTECIETATLVAETFCSVNYTGNCAPHLIWKYENDNNNFKAQQEFTCFNQSFSMAETKMVTAIESGRRLICHIEDLSQDVAHQFQCNTSVVPAQCQKNQPAVVANDSMANSRKIILIVVLTIILTFTGISISVAVIVYWRCRKRKRKPGKAQRTDERNGNPAPLL